MPRRLAEQRAAGERGAGSSVRAIAAVTVVVAVVIVVVCAADHYHHDARAVCDLDLASHSGVLLAHGAVAAARRSVEESWRHQRDAAVRLGTAAAVPTPRARSPRP